ncbi:MAG: 50S ribosomal protein L22 [Cytophagaceae bacterium]
MEAVAKQKRSVIKKRKKEAAKEAAKHGAVKTQLNNVPTSPRKMRLIADLIRGQKVNFALGLLRYQPQSGAARLEKLLLSAIADWQLKNPDARLEDADLIIREIFVDGGRILKRLRPAPQGRAHRIRKRSNHVTLVIDSANGIQTTTAVVEEPKAEKKETKKEAKPKAPKAETKKTSKKSDNK